MFGLKLLSKIVKGDRIHGWINIGRISWYSNVRHRNIHGVHVILLLPISRLQDYLNFETLMVEHGRRVPCISIWLEFCRFRPILMWCTCMHPVGLIEVKASYEEVQDGYKPQYRSLVENIHHV